MSRFIEFTRAEWARLRLATPLPLSEPQLRELVGLNEWMSLDEVAAIYLPLSRLLNLYVGATQRLHDASNTFLGAAGPRMPYSLIGVAGSVAVGKSTMSRILQALLARWPSHPQVDLITTDGFLLPQRVLEARGMAHRKGFPESYDVRTLVRFLADVKSGVPEVVAPVYSHLAYDIVPGAQQVVRQPDIVIVEGLNVLQTGSGRTGRPMPMSSRTSSISRSTWTHRKPTSSSGTSNGSRRFGRPFSRTPRPTFTATPRSRRRKRRPRHAASGTRSTSPTCARTCCRRGSVHLILQKGRDHAVRRVRLRKL